MGSCCCVHVRRYELKKAATTSDADVLPVKAFDGIKTSDSGVYLSHRCQSTTNNVSNDVSHKSPYKPRSLSNHSKVNDHITSSGRRKESLPESNRSRVSNQNSRHSNNTNSVHSNVADSGLSYKEDSNNSFEMENSDATKVNSAGDKDFCTDNLSCDTISEVSSHSDLGSELPNIIYNSIPETLPASRQTSQVCSSIDGDVKDNFSNERSPCVTFSDVNCHVVGGLSSGESEDEDYIPVRKLERSIPGKMAARPYQASRLGRAISRSTSTESQEYIHWKKGNRLGRGTFGTVFLGLTSTGELIAVKQVELIETDFEEAEKEYAKIYQEVLLLKTLKHRNIVGYLGSNYEIGVISIFIEFIAGGSLLSILEKFGPLEEPVIRRYSIQLLDAVAYLHDNHVVHRDIKSANIMLVPNGTVKLIDFGCAKRLALRLSRSGSHLQMSLRGTPYWMAPEVINESGHGKKSDIWSLGCTLFEMFSGKPPWGDREPLAAIYAIGSEEFAVPTLPEESFSEEVRGFVQLFMIRDKRKRPNATDLIKHPFLTSYDSGSTPASPNRL